MTYLCQWPACKALGCVDCNCAVPGPEDVWLEDGEDDAPDEDPEPPGAPQQPYVPNGEWPFN